MANKEWLFTELEDLKNRIWINVAKDEQCIVAEKCGSIHGLSSSNWSQIVFERCPDF